MDILDIAIAKAMTPQQLSSYLAEAQRATSIAAEAADNISALTAQTVANNEASAAALENTVGTIHTELDKLVLELTTLSSQDVISANLIMTYPDQSIKAINNAIKYYTTTGNNTDGTMTQKAITQAILQNASNNEAISNLGNENAGKVVVVGPDGQITASNISESKIMELLITGNNYQIEGTVGLQIDYVNKNFSRFQEMDSQNNYESYFSAYPMYGGRIRCNVSDNGTITAFIGEDNYTEDGSNGQVMVYQPKFYYTRMPTLNVDGTIEREAIIISAKKENGFKIHPLFISEMGEQLDYVLLSAFQGCAYDVSASQYNLRDESSVDFNSDKLSSIAGAKPISGVNKNLTMINAEKLAANRGEGWHITNMAAESACQFLQAIEFGTLNGQNILGPGLSALPNDSSANCSSITGSTSFLMNGTGQALSTQNEIKGTYTTYNTSGRCAISYRGMENPWGNIWHYVGGVIVKGNGSQKGGIVYICKNYNYDSSQMDVNYDTTEIMLPSSSGYISNFGIKNTKYDWAFIPIGNSDGNSALPVGDTVWTTNNLNGLHFCASSGHWGLSDKNGIFTYSCDQTLSSVGRAFGARLMFIPKKNSIYTANINKHSSHI